MGLVILNPCGLASPAKGRKLRPSLSLSLPSWGTAPGEAPLLPRSCLPLPLHGGVGKVLCPISVTRRPMTPDLGSYFSLSFKTAVFPSGWRCASNLEKLMEILMLEAVLWLISANGSLHSFTPSFISSFTPSFIPSLISRHQALGLCWAPHLPRWVEHSQIHQF